MLVLWLVRGSCSLSRAKTARGLGKGQTKRHHARSQSRSWAAGTVDLVSLM